MVTTISATDMTVLFNLPTVLTEVRWVDAQFRLSPVRIFLMIITVLLIITVTVSMSVYNANKPRSNFIRDRTKKALTRVIGTVTAGTNAEWKLRKKTHIMTNIRTNVLTNAPIILRTEVKRKLPVPTETPSPNLAGNAPDVLLNNVLTLSTARAVPAFVTRHMT